MFASSELFPVQGANRKWGYINKIGSYVVAPQFKMAAARPFKEGRAAVQIDNKWGYIDPKGSIIVEPQFHVALDFSQGLAMVQNVSYSYDQSGSASATGGASLILHHGAPFLNLT